MCVNIFFTWNDMPGNFWNGEGVMSVNYAQMEENQKGDIHTERRKHCLASFFSDVHCKEEDVTVEVIELSHTGGSFFPPQ